MKHFRISKGVDDFKRVYYVERLTKRSKRHGFLWSKRRTEYRWEYVKDIVIGECGYDYFIKPFKSMKSAEKYIKLFKTR